MRTTIFCKLIRQISSRESFHAALHLNSNKDYFTTQYHGKSLLGRSREPQTGLKESQMGLKEPQMGLKESQVGFREPQVNHREPRRASDSQE